VKKSLEEKRSACPKNISSQASKENIGDSEGAAATGGSEWSGSKKNFDQKEKSDAPWIGVEKKKKDRERRLNFLMTSSKRASESEGRIPPRHSRALKENA